MSDYMDDPVNIPIDGTLDLHHFRPQEISDLVAEYINECKKHGITTVRIIHGKGTGTLRQLVHSTLRKNSQVESYRLADETGGGWGATLVQLK